MQAGMGSMQCFANHRRLWRMLEAAETVRWKASNMSTSMAYERTKHTMTAI